MDSIHTFDADEFVAKLIKGAFDRDLQTQLRKLSYDQLKQVEYLVEMRLEGEAGRCRPRYRPAGNAQA